jgi:hypothetical protein
MQSGYSQNGKSTPTFPYLLTRSDFSKLYPAYQKMALALMQTGKVVIVDDDEPSPALHGLAPKGLPSQCTKSPISAPGGPSSAGPERARDVAVSAGGAGGPQPPSGAARRPALGYYRLIRNETPESEWVMVDC